MTNIELLKIQSEFAYAELKTTLEGVSEGEAWSVIPPADDDYLHTDGSIQGIVLHIATGKFIYGSVAFRDSEVRWRHCADRMDEFEPNWAAAVAYLDEAHTYWLSTWADLTDEDLTREVPHFRGRLWPAWKVIQMIIHHDSYHAGQIPVIRYATTESTVPPASSAADIRQHCRELPSW